MFWYLPLNHKTEIRGQPAEGTKTFAHEALVLEKIYTNPSSTVYIVKPQWNKTFNKRWALMEDNLQWKTTFDGRWQLEEDNLSLNHLVWKRTVEGKWPSIKSDLQRKKIFNEEQHLMEEKNNNHHHNSLKNQSLFLSYDFVVVNKQALLLLG